MSKYHGEVDLGVSDNQLIHFDQGGMVTESFAGSARPEPGDCVQWHSTGYDRGYAKVVATEESGEPGKIQITILKI